MIGHDYTKIGFSVASTTVTSGTCSVYYYFGVDINDMFDRDNEIKAAKQYSLDFKGF